MASVGLRMELNQVVNSDLLGHISLLSPSALKPCTSSPAWISKPCNEFFGVPS